MSTPLTAEEKEQRSVAKNKLENSTALIIVEDEFTRTYVKRIFREILELENTVEFTTPDEAIKYLEQYTRKDLSCVVSSVNFLDGSTGADFLRYLRSTPSPVVAPFVLIGDNTDAAIQYVFLVKHFAGHINQSFTPSEFVRMLLEVFTVRDRRREKRELDNDEKNSRPFNRLYQGGKKIDKD